MASSHIRSIGKNDAEKIRSLERIADLAECVRELVENALDAGATAIEIKINFSAFSLSVLDNGSSLSVDSLRHLCAERHATSKVQNFHGSPAGNISSRVSTAKYASQNTYGFRGESLHSISVLSKLEIQAKERASELMASKLINRGKTVQTTVVADTFSPSGTRVIVEEARHICRITSRCCGGATQSQSSTQSRPDPAIWSAAAGCRQVRRHGNARRERRLSVWTRARGSRRRLGSAFHEHVAIGSRARARVVLVTAAVGPRRSIHGLEASHPC